MNIASGPMLYYLHPDVSFFKGNGFTALGPYLDMPDNSSAGNVSALGLIEFHPTKVACVYVPRPAIPVSCSRIHAVMRGLMRVRA